jgi:hypothetical protein
MITCHGRRSSSLNAHAATDPSAAQIEGRDWLPEAVLFPAVDPHGRRRESAALFERFPACDFQRI